MGWPTGNPGGRRFPFVSAQENKEMALSLIEALNARDLSDLSLWSQRLSEDYAAEHPGGLSSWTK